MTEPTELTPADLDRLEAQAAAADSSPNDMIVWEDTAWAYSVLAMVPDTVRALVAGYRRMLAAREQLAQVEARFADGDEHFPWSATEFGTLCCCGEAMDDQERCLSNKGLQQRAEAAEADCVALRQALERTVPVCSCPSCRGHRSILASPNPGAGLAGRAGAGPEAHRGAGGWSPLSEISKRAACYRMIAAMPDEEMAYIANLLAQPASYYLPEAMDLIAELEANP